MFGASEGGQHLRLVKVVTQIGDNEVQNRVSVRGGCYDLLQAIVLAEGCYWEVVKVAADEKSRAVVHGSQLINGEPKVLFVFHTETCTRARWKVDCCNAEIGRACREPSRPYLKPHYFYILLRRLDVVQQLHWNRVPDVAADAASPTVGPGSLEEAEAGKLGFVLIHLPDFRDAYHVWRVLQHARVQLVQLVTE